MKRLLHFLKAFCKVLSFLICLNLTLLSNLSYSQNCGPNVPSFQVNLSNNVNGVWISPDTARFGNCCGTVSPDKCVEFVITLHPNATHVSFNIFSGAIPGGALFYQINCGPQQSLGQPICLNGSGPHTITFCKPGNNNNTYIIQSGGKAEAGNDVTVNDGCSDTLFAFGYDENTLQWNSIYPGIYGQYNNYLSCTNCDTAFVYSQPNFPSYVDYQVCGYPKGGCDTTLICDTLRVYFNSSLSVTINPQNPTICYGDTSIQLTAVGSGGKPPYSYLWSNNDTSANTNVGPGTYIVYIKDGTDCPASSDTITVTQFSNTITANAGPDLTVCLDDLPIFLNGSVTGVTNGQWSGGAGNYSPSFDSLQTYYQPTPGEIDQRSFSLYLTTVGNGTCPGDVDTINISLVEFDAQVTKNIQHVSCKGLTDGRISLTYNGGTPPFTTTWNVANLPQGDSLTNLAPMTGTFTVVDGNGCDSTFTFTITEPDALSVIFNKTNPKCYNSCDGSANAIVSGGTAPYQYSWSNSVTSQTNSNLCNGSTGITITDARGCVLTSSVSVTAPTQLASSITPIEPMCKGFCDGKLNLTVSGGTPGYTYNWSNNTQNQNATSLCTGNYSVIITDNNGCKDTATAFLNEPSSVILTVSNDTSICNNGMAKVFASATGGNQGNYTFNWFNSNLSGAGPHYVNPPQNFCYKVFAQDSKGCTSNIDSICVSYPPQLKVKANNDTLICENEVVNLIANASGGVNSNYSYQWSNGANQSSTSVSPTSYPNSSQYYIVVTDECGATAKDSVVIGFHPTPTQAAMLENSKGCEPLTVKFISNSLNSNFCTWNIGNSIKNNCDSFNFTFYDPGKYPITLNLESDKGCKSKINFNDLVEVYPNPKAHFYANSYEESILNPDFEFINTSEGYVSSKWNLGDGTLSFNKNAKHTYADTGNYVVKLTVTSSHQCKDSTTRVIRVTPYFTVYIPNTFTPEHGINQTFFPKGIGLVDEGFEMQIFNRWGELIYTSNELSKGWDGTAKGGSEIVQTGVYVYKIRVQDFKGLKHDFIGNINLLK